MLSAPSFRHASGPAAQLAARVWRGHHTHTCCTSSVHSGAHPPSICKRATFICLFILFYFAVGLYSGGQASLYAPPAAHFVFVFPFPPHSLSANPTRGRAHLPGVCARGGCPTSPPTMRRMSWVAPSPPLHSRRRWILSGMRGANNTAPLRRPPDDTSWRGCPGRRTAGRRPADGSCPFSANGRGKHARGAATASASVLSASSLLLSMY